ncbi:hypothetical protein QJS10_CPB17g01130 [Acorus calamus]|uniref:UspA domain-containing protein n=1 Tax=Acorus calamus TaxID=4465 RepID=A0AAV9CQQ7_ACOCL|nr:hypothetical protein QJS10_CPB17g01130 [Acorus calamus]
MADVAEERRIVVAVDEGDESMYALTWCLKNFVSPNTENTFILLYVRPPPPIFNSLDGTGYLFAEDVVVSMEKYSQDLAESVMEKAKNIYKNFDNVKVEKKVGLGDARDVICEMVVKLGADVLVIGTHSYGFIKRTLLGSVSDYCARNAKCPVLIVKR